MEKYFSKKLELWPPNSPDLSPIEDLWAIIEEKLQHYNFITIEELTQRLLLLWNRIPKTLSKNLVSSFDKKIEREIKDSERVNKRFIKIKKRKFGEWKTKWNENDFIERIYYIPKGL